MRYFELILESEEFANGKYVAFDLTHETKQKLYNFCVESNIPNKLQLDEFHITLVHSNVDFEWDPLEEIDDEDSAIDAETYSWELFGEDNNILVLRVQHDFLDDRYMDAMTAGAKSDFPSYKPHISMSYDVDPDFDIKNLATPKFQIILKCEEQAEAR